QSNESYTFSIISWSDSSLFLGVIVHSLYTSYLDIDDDFKYTNYLFIYLFIRWKFICVPTFILCISEKLAFVSNTYNAFFSGEYRGQTRSVSHGCRLGSICITLPLLSNQIVSIGNFIPCIQNGVLSGSLNINNIP